MADTSLSPAQQAQLVDFENKHKELLDKQATLKQEQLTLLQQSRTAEQEARLNNITNEIIQIKSDLTELTKEISAVTLPTETIIKDTIKQDNVKEITAKQPPPPKGAVNIIHGHVKNNDIINYMNFTQYLNPYGRKRKCDEDLENLMSVINKDCNNQLAEYAKLTKEISDLVKS